MTQLWKRVLVLAVGGMVSFGALGAEFGTIKGLWDFTGNEPQGASSLTSDEDFAPELPGRELLVFSSSASCQDDPAGPIWKFKERRTFYSTDGDELATFETPTITLQSRNFEFVCVNGTAVTLTSRSSTAFAEDKGTRVYVYSRAFYPPANPLGGVWHISVFRLDGTLLWSLDIRPSDPSAPPVDRNWNIITARSAVGNLLDHGKRNDVIRIAMTYFNPSTGERRVKYRFLDLLTGGLAKLVVKSPEAPELD